MDCDLGRPDPFDGGAGGSAHGLSAVRASGARATRDVTARWTLSTSTKLRRGVLRPALLGVVAAARELQDVGLPHGIEIDAPRAFDEEYRRCT